jgi:hypothetical protein
MNENWYKNNQNDQIWWKRSDDSIGEHIFSFDKMKEFNLFQDYPYALTEEQKKMFDSENPFWADFFKDRTCAHDWQLVQEAYLHKQMAGRDIVYDLYVCKKCGTQDTRAQKHWVLCPHCNKPLSFLMPGGNILYCNWCEKCFENNNGAVGKETKSPYVNPNALY